MVVLISILFTAIADMQYQSELELFSQLKSADSLWHQRMIRVSGRLSALKSHLISRTPLVRSTITKFMNESKACSVPHTTYSTILLISIYCSRAHCSFLSATTTTTTRIRHHRTQRQMISTTPESRHNNSSTTATLKCDAQKSIRHQTWGSQNSKVT